MPTPHNNAAKGQIAETVLMPGDPARAKMVAETYLSNIQIVNNVRDNYCYTGTYKGKPVSVMASGMGMPSIGIYSYELYKEYEVNNIIRIGTAGAYTEALKVNEMIIADSSYSESSYARVQSGYDKDVTYPSSELVKKLQTSAENLGLKATTARLHSSDVFYRTGGLGYVKDLVENHQCAAVEMESFALFHTASLFGKNAACICTISDSFVSPEILSPEERQNTLHNMIRTALETLLL